MVKIIKLKCLSKKLNKIYIVKWGKEQPKITNLALTPQPKLIEMKVICQLTRATSKNDL